MHRTKWTPLPTPSSSRVTAAGSATTRSVDLLPPFECSNILSRKREPFALLSLARKSTMPAGFNPSRIIRLDDVNRFDLLWKLDADLALPSEPVICTADFVFTTSAVLEKVDIANNSIIARHLIILVRGQRCTEVVFALLYYVVEPLLRTAVLNELPSHLRFGSE